LSFNALDFISTTPDRRVAQARNPAQAFNTAATPLQRQQTDKAAPAFLIQGHQHSIDRPVLLGDGTPGMLMTDGARASLICSFRLTFHSLSPVTRHRVAWPGSIHCA
jgi:hypothetical protein